MTPPRGLDEPTRAPVTGPIELALVGHETVTFDLSAAAIALGIADGMPSTLTLSGGFGRGERARGRTFHVNLTGRRHLRGRRTA